MRLGSVTISRKQVIGAVLAWALVGALLLMRSFSMTPKSPAAAPAGKERDVTQTGSLVLDAPPVDRSSGNATASKATQSINTVSPASAPGSITGLPAVDNDLPVVTDELASSTPTVKPKPGQSVLGDEGGVYYFPTPGSGAQIPTATWFVRIYTPSPSLTARATYTPSSTPTPRASFTPRYPATATSTPSLTPTSTNTFTPTATHTPSLTPSHTMTASSSPIITDTATPTATHTATATLPAELPSTGSLVFVSRGAAGAVDSVNLLQLPGAAFEKVAELDRVELCAWSPDGTTLLVQLPRGDGGLTDLHALAVDGTLVTLTTALPGSSQCGDWIGDGETILFPYTDPAGVSILLELNLVTGNELQVYTHAGVITRPDLAPDGKQVVFIAQNGDTQDVVLLNLETGTALNLTDSLEAEDTPRFSPDGQLVVFARLVDERWRLFMINLATREESILALTSGNEMQPDWSPDGQYLLFTSDESGTRNIYTCKPDEDASIHLLPDPANQDTPLWRP